MSKQHNIITIDDVTLLHETEKAYLFATEAGIEVWVPKSMCDWNGKELQMDETVATNKGLI